MKKIDIIPWNENFNTVINQIDKEHKKLVEIINNLATEFAYNSNELDINIIFNELIDYTKYHFNSEEPIWEKYLKNEETKTAHIKTHNSFIDKLNNLIEQQKMKPIEEIAENTLNFLVQWLVSHILESDRYLAYKVFSIKEGYSIKEASLIAKEKMTGETKKLTNLVMSMYKILSTNTLNLMKEKAKQEKVQKKLYEEKTKYQKLMMLGSDMVYILDFKGNIVDYSEQVQKNLGYDDEEMKSLTLFDIDKALTPEINKEYLKLLSDDPIKFPTIHTKKMEKILM